MYEVLTMIAVAFSITSLMLVTWLVYKALSCLFTPNDN